MQRLVGNGHKISYPQCCSMKSLYCIRAHVYSHRYMHCKLTCSYDVFILFLTHFFCYGSKANRGPLPFFPPYVSNFWMFNSVNIPHYLGPFQEKDKSDFFKKGKHFQIAYLRYLDIVPDTALF